MNVVFLNIYPAGSMARYLLSSYVLRAYLLEYAAASEHLRTTVINMGEKAPIERIVSKVVAAEPDVVCYSCYLWNIKQNEKVIDALRTRGNFWHVLGGPEVSPSSIDGLIRRGIGDFYISGEGEKPLLGLIEDIAKRGRAVITAPPPGVMARSAAGLLDGGSADPLDLATVPSVYLTGVIEPVHYSGQQAYLETQRGCKNRCAYCVYHKSLPRIQYHPIERIKRELDYLILEHKIKALRIFDAVFASDLSRAKELVRHLLEIKEKLARDGRRLPWIYWEFVYSQVDEEFLELTADLKYRREIANSASIEAANHPQLYTDFLQDYTVINCIGVQSFNPASLRAVKRPAVSPRKFEIFTEWIRKYNVVLKVDLIYGLPFETEDSFWQGVEALLPLFVNSDHVLNIHRLQMLPGSEMESRAEDLGLHWDHARDHLVDYTTALSAEEIRYGSKLIAMLFRMVNSPLRADFFRACGKADIPVRDFCALILRNAEDDARTAQSRLVVEHEVDDVYWNDAVFHEIPSAWIKERLEEI